MTDLAIAAAQRALTRLSAEMAQMAARHPSTFVDPEYCDDIGIDTKKARLSALADEAATIMRDPVAWYNALPPF